MLVGSGAEKGRTSSSKGGGGEDEDVDVGGRMVELVDAMGRSSSIGICN